VSARRPRGDDGKPEPGPRSGERSKQRSKERSREGKEAIAPAPESGDAQEPPGESAFARAVRDVKPLAGRDKIRRASPKVSATRRSQPQGEVHFELPQPDEPLLGYAEGVNRRQLKRLRSGQIRPESSLDLHRLQAEPGRTALHHHLIQAQQAGQRCVLVIHGRGLRSSEGPVLRRALPAWLADAKVARVVLAFAPARPEDGGEGASYVLLRRSRGSAIGG
jgi:DNA-nicking Smr family endonuclease